MGISHSKPQNATKLSTGAKEHLNTTRKIRRVQNSPIYWITAYSAVAISAEESSIRPVMVHIAGVNRFSLIVYTLVIHIQ